MTENKEASLLNNNLIIDILRESGVEAIGIERRSTLKVIGASVNDATEFVASTTSGELPIFVKFFRDERLEVAAESVDSELKATQKLNKLIPGISYIVIAYRKGTNDGREIPVIITETIPDSVTLDSYLNGTGEQTELALIKNTLNLLSFVHKNGIIHGDARARNFSLVAGRQFEDTRFNGVIIIDFEKGKFKENLTDVEFEELMKADVLKFLLSTFPIIENEKERPNWRQELSEYFKAQKEMVGNTLRELYGESFAEAVQSELQINIDAIVNPEE